MLKLILSCCRATFYETPEFGSCGYGRLDTGVYEFGPDAVGAFPDVRK